MARTRCAAGCRFLPSVAAHSSFLAGSACPVLTRCCRLAGTQPTLLRDKQLCCCMALLRHIQVPPSAVSPRLYSAFLQLYLGCFAGGVALPCCLFLHASRVPSPQQWGSGLLKAHAHEHCEANSQPFPHCERHKPTNCNKTQKGQKIKGQMGHAGLICTEFPCSVHGCNPIKLVPAHVLGFATCLFLESSPPSYKKQTEKSLPISLICVTHNDTVHKAHPGIGTMH